MRGFASGSSAFVTTFPHGLTNLSATGDFFTTQLDLDTPLLMRDTSADFWQAALADAEDRGIGVEA